MYPYRCEACGVRFYRKVPVGEGLGQARYPTPRHRPPPSRRSVPSQAEKAEVVTQPAPRGDSLSHGGFLDLIDSVNRPKQHRQADAPEKKEEDH